MQDSQIPAKFNLVWGADAGAGYIRAIPVASQIGVQNGAASLTDGFPPLTFQPVGAGGVPPFGQDVNGILNQVTAWNQWQAAGGPITYDAAFQSAIGGYPKGAIIQSATTAGSFWRSTADNNTTNPDTGGAGWVLAIPYALAGTTIPGAMGVSGAASLGSTLSVTGVTTLSGGVTGGLDVTGSLSASGGVSTTTLSASGAATLSAGLSVSGGAVGVTGWTSTAGGTYFTATPSDFGSGKPQLFISKVSGNPAGWTFGSYDGVTVGTANLSMEWSAITTTGSFATNSLTVTNGFTVGSGTVSLPNASITGAMLGTGAALANLGFTPLNESNNLSDLPNKATACTNLGLGILATSAGLTLHVVVFTTPGSFSYTVPAHILTSGYGVATGAGGGAAGSTASRCGGGGGAGGTAEGPLILTPNGTITGTVGTGGTGGASGVDGGNGGNTTLGPLTGDGGVGGAVEAAVAGGTGGGATGGTINLVGGCGIDGLTTSSIAPWACGGASRWGGGLRAGNGGAITANAAPGSGGGAAYAAATAGGNGVNGIAVLYYWTY